MTKHSLLGFHCFLCQGTQGRKVLCLPPTFFEGERNHLAESGLYQDYCVNCGTLINMAPNRISQEFYQKQYKKNFDSSTVYVPTRHNHETKAKLNADFITQHIERPGKLLEVGAHMGCFMAALQKRGWNVAGIEPSSTLCRIGAESYGLKIKTGYYHRDSYQSEELDLVTFDNVLEHPDAPLELLAAAHYHLKLEGHLFFILPVLDTIRTGQIGGWHLSILSSKGWKYLIEQCGFHIKHLELDGLGGGDSARLRCLAQKVGNWPLTINFSPQMSFFSAWLGLTKMVVRHKLGRFFRNI
ncbi:MAG: class I SAM-dependent methyltransferase [Pseudomonadota bacterium]